MNTPNVTEQSQGVAGGSSSATLLGLGLYVIEAKHRSRDKNLGPWKAVAAFVEREDAYSFYGNYHQGRAARVLSPNESSSAT